MTIEKIFGKKNEHSFFVIHEEPITYLYKNSTKKGFLAAKEESQNILDKIEKNKNFSSTEADAKIAFLTARLKEKDEEITKLFGLLKVAKLELKLYIDQEIQKMLDLLISTSQDTYTTLANYIHIVVDETKNLIGGKEPFLGLPKP